MICWDILDLEAKIHFISKFTEYLSAETKNTKPVLSMIMMFRPRLDEIQPAKHLFYKLKMDISAWLHELCHESPPYAKDEFRLRRLREYQDELSKLESDSAQSEDVVELVLEVDLYSIALKSRIAQARQHMKQRFSVEETRDFVGSAWGIYQRCKSKKRFWPHLVAGRITSLIMEQAIKCMSKASTGTSKDISTVNSSVFYSNSCSVTSLSTRDTDTSAHDHEWHGQQGFQGCSSSTESNHGYDTSVGLGYGSLDYFSFSKPRAIEAQTYPETNT